MPAVELTVLIITYNHAGFIETAVDSVLMQETDFEYEIIISEDFSTDGTRHIVEQLAEAHPDRIRLCLSDRNLNDNTVMRRGFEAARGNYMALLDGDDFWTAKDKLQKQVGFLVTHPECSSCFHNVDVTYEGNPDRGHLWHQEDRMEELTAPKPKPISTLADIVRGDFIATCSVVFRSDATRELPPWFDDVTAGDWAIHLLCAEHGYLGYLDAVMGTYRVHPGGFWTMGQSTYARLADVEAVAATYDAFNGHLAFSFDREISEEVAKLYEHVAVLFYKRGESGTAAVCARRALGRARATQWPGRWRSLAVLVLARLSRLIPSRLDGGRLSG